MKRDDLDELSLPPATVDEGEEELRAQLQDARDRFAALVEDLPYAYFTADLTGTLTSANRAFTALTGYTAEDRPNFMEVILPEDLSRAMEDLARVATEPNDGPREYRFRHADGAVLHVEVNTVPLMRHGELVGYQGTGRDVTQQKAAAAALANSEQRLRELAEMLPGIVFEYDLQGTVTYTNRHTLELTGYTQQDIDDGLNILDTVAPQDRERAAANMLPLFQGKPLQRNEYEVLLKDGSRMPVEIRSAPIHRDGEVVGVRSLAHDLSDIRRAVEERRRLERQVQRAQKQESLGVLAGGVAHDFNNVLQVVLGNVSLALLQAEPDTPLAKRLDAIRRATRHARDLCSQMLAYSGSSPVMAGPTGLNDALGEILELVTATLSKAVTLTVELEPEPLWVEADQTQLQQVFLNLVNNAAEALGAEPGRITVRTRSVDAQPADLVGTTIDDALPPGQYAMLEVSDDGHGMDEETLQRVFDPFFTTKFTGRGLGLAAAFGIVRAHRGVIQAKSRPGEGTTFRVLLPQTCRAVGSPVERTGTDAARDPVQPRTTVLLVDDEPDVRESTSLILEEAGYTVLTAAEGRAALEVYDQCADQVGLVLLDLSMPGLDGLATFTELRRRDARLPVVLCSGYSRPDVVERFGAERPDAFLKKPYEMDELLQTARRALRKR